MAGNARHDADHRQNAEELLEQLAGMLHQDNGMLHHDKLTAEVSRARRRRAVARHSIAVRLLAGRSGRAAAW